MVIGSIGDLVRLACGDKRLAPRANSAVILGYPEQPLPDQLDSPNDGKRLKLSSTDQCPKGAESRSK